MQIKSIMRSRRTLAVYLTLGDVIMNDDVVRVLAGAGVDVLEVGLPSVKSKYDGPVVRRSMARALERNGGGRVNLGIVSQLLFEPKVLFTYYEVASEYGVEEFFNEAADGVRAVLFPDLLIDFQDRLDEYLRLCEVYGFEPVFFITSTFPHRLISRLASFNPAFIYLGLMVSTGVQLPIFAERNISVMKSLLGDVPLLAGFAVRSGEQVARYIKAGADGVVVGSYLIKALEEAPEGDRPEVAVRILRPLREALDDVGKEMV